MEHDTDRTMGAVAAGRWDRRASVRSRFLALLPFLLAVAVACGRPPAASACDCGVERWSVKTGTDADAGSVALETVTATTVEALGAQPRPASVPEDGRAGEVERTVWSVTATLVKVKREKDSDYHAILRDGTSEMVVELVDPCCVGPESPFLPAITRVRAAFDSSFGTPGTHWREINARVAVTGIGMFDRLHGQTGASPNGIELHPVLSIELRPAALVAAAREIVENGGFEETTDTGRSVPGWEVTSNLPRANYVSTGGLYPHAGSRYAYLGVRNNSTGVLRQTLAIPADAHSVRLRFWASVVTSEARQEEGFDFLRVEIEDEAGSVLETPFTLWNDDAGESGNDPAGYVQSPEIDLSGFRGRTIGLVFRASCDDSHPTTFRLDDVSVLVEE